MRDIRYTRVRHTYRHVVCNVCACQMRVQNSQLPHQNGVEYLRFLRKADLRQPYNARDVEKKRKCETIPIIPFICDRRGGDRRDDADVAG